MNQSAIIQEADETRDLTGFSNHNDCKGVIMRSKKSIKERLLDKVCIDTDTKCWLWTDHKNTSGYGRITFDGVGRMAHRASYEVFVGPIPEGLQCCHKCDVRHCVNPEHLFLGTNADNHRDKAEKGRATKGEESHLSKLNEREVKAIREMLSRFPYARNGRGKNAGLRAFLAEWFGVTISLIKQIKSESIWKHVQ